jgi:hypothetical protein
MYRDIAAEKDSPTARVKFMTATFLPFAGDRDSFSTLLYASGYHRHRNREALAG